MADAAAAVDEIEAGCETYVKKKKKMEEGTRLSEAFDHEVGKRDCKLGGWMQAMRGHQP